MAGVLLPPPPLLLLLLLPLLLLLLLLVVKSSGPNRSTNSQRPVGPHPLAPTGTERGTSRFGQLVLGAKGATPE